MLGLLRYYQKQVGLILLSSLLCMTSLASPQQWAVLRSKMTIEQFKALVQAKLLETGSIPKAPHLQSDDPHVMGGDVRGVIKWILEASQLKSLPEIEASRGIRIFMKAAVFSDDHDLVLFKFKGESEGFFTMRMRLAVKTDFHSESFYWRSVRAGGSAIEKVAIGANSIIDPYGALDSLYQTGHIPFILNDNPLPKDDGFQNNNSKISLLLRHLRFVQDLGASFTDDEIGLWKDFVHEELRKGVLAQDFFIEKQLEKLAKHFRVRQDWISKDGREFLYIA